MLSKSEQDKIKKIIQERNITELKHITFLKNLALIASVGLLPRDYLEKKFANFYYSDEKRLDCKSLQKPICLSISKANKDMFSYKIYNSNLEKKDLVELTLDPSILYKKDCYFYPYNAASRQYIHTDLKKYHTAEALEQMFESRIEVELSMKNKLIIRPCDLPLNTPTSIQAEVLCFDAIESSFITEVKVFNSQTNQFEKIL